tara:strand:- start:5806 stop:6699 length:894 start_codon:yes stop_codon:yes gene_type:complete
MKIIRALSNPKYSLSFVLGNIIPNYFRKRYLNQSKKNGLGKKYFILSFDCDTEKDIEVVEEVDKKLRELNITASYAVPGELLRLGRDVYTRLYKNGSEFLNHGYLSHTSYIKKTCSYISTLFYDQLSNEQVKDDIIKGHNNFIDVLGELPLGFRTPHFGSYQKPYQLKLLYSVLSKLNYSFSSSTTPVTAMWKGPIVRTSSGIIELPVSGCYDYPARILDSWNFRFSPTRKLNEKDYFNQFKKMIDFFDVPNMSGIFNIYADPSQVYDWELFFECMKMTDNLKKISFSELVKEVYSE